MKKINSVLILICSLFMFTANGAGKRTELKIAITPLPAFIEAPENNSRFTITPKTTIYLCDTTEGLRKAATYFSNWSSRSLGTSLPLKYSGKKINKGIVLMTDNNLEEEEYILDINKKRIHIAGGSPRAVFYAFQSLRQLCPPEAEIAEKTKKLTVPGVYIKDKPDFTYRGAMLDVCRHFFTIEEVKQFIDMLVLHKINTFHWHLSDDQGWRIEIKKYPLLTEIGSQRDATIIGHAIGSTRYDNTPYGGYYTQDQIKEVVRYADDHFITVIPEIEMPGHALAALASYPYLGCEDKDYKVCGTWGVFDEVYCAGKDSTFEFMENVLSEVIELFPSKYIHIGGDECPKKAWKNCALCQKRIKELSLKNENELQSYFVRRIEKFLNTHDRKLIGWDEIMEGGLSKTSTVMSWRGTQGGIDAAKMGNYAIMTPTNYCYFDYYQSKAKASEHLAIGGYVPVSQVYSLDPYEKLNENEKKFILGVQCNTWTEYIPNFNHLQYMVLPRMAALAEVGWSYSRKNYDDFLQRLTRLTKRYDALDYNYAKHVFENR